MVAPIVGRFHKYVARDVFFSLVASIGAASWMWYGYSVPFVNKCENYLNQVRAETLQNHEDWLKSVAAEKK